MFSPVTPGSIKSHLKRLRTATSIFTTFQSSIERTNHVTATQRRPWKGFTSLSTVQTLSSLLAEQRCIMLSKTWQHSSAPGGFMSRSAHLMHQSEVQVWHIGRNDLYFTRKRVSRGRFA